MSNRHSAISTRRSQVHFRGSMSSQPRPSSCWRLSCLYVRPQASEKKLALHGNGDKINIGSKIKA